MESAATLKVPQNIEMIEIDAVTRREVEEALTFSRSLADWPTNLTLGRRLTQIHADLPWKSTKSAFSAFICVLFSVSGVKC